MEKLTEKTLLKRLKSDGMKIGFEILKELIPCGAPVAKGILAIGENLFGE